MNLNTTLVTSTDAADNCTFFEQQRDYESAMVRRYGLLIFLVATAVAASLIGLIIAAAIKQYGAAASTLVGTIVSGSAMAFVFKMQKNHQMRVRQWVDAIDKNCGS